MKVVARELVGVACAALLLVAQEGDAVAESRVQSFLEKYDVNKDGAIDVSELEEFIHELTGTEGGFCEPAQEIMEISGVLPGEKANDTVKIQAVLANMYHCVSKLATAAQVNITTSSGDSFTCVPGGDIEHSHEETLSLRVLLGGDDEHEAHGEHEAERMIDVHFGSKALNCSLQEAEIVQYEITRETWARALGAGAIAALCSLVGATLLLCNLTSLKSQVLDDMVAFAVGVLLAAVFIHMLPEGVEMAGGFDWKISVTFLSGVFLAFGIEIGASMLGSSGHAHLHGPADVAVVSIEEMEESLSKNAIEGGPLDRALIANIIIGDGLHNLTDGFLIGIAFSACADSSLGWVVTAAILAHEIPQEMVDFIILMRAGLSSKMALLWNFMSSVTSILGVVLILLLNTAITVRQRGFLLAFGGGLLAYIALAELLPSLISKGSNKRKLLRAFFVFTGLLLIGLLQLFHPHCESADTIHSAHNH